MNIEQFGSNLHEKENLKGFHEGGAEEVFGKEFNKKTAEHGVVFDENGIANVPGSKVLELIEKDIASEAVFYDQKYALGFFEDSEGNDVTDEVLRSIKLDKKFLESIPNVELHAGWTGFSFDLPTPPLEAPEDLAKIIGDESSWLVPLRLTKEEKDNIWYETRERLGFTREEIEEARRNGEFPSNPK